MKGAGSKLFAGLGPPCFIAVLRVDLSLPGARSLKDRRQVIVSLRDRLRSRFAVSCHELRGDDPSRASLVVTTGGSEAGVLASTLDKIRAAVGSHAGAVLLDAQVEVRGWPDPEPWRDDEHEEDDDV